MSDRCMDYLLARSSSRFEPERSGSFEERDVTRGVTCPKVSFGLSVESGLGKQHLPRIEKKIHAPASAVH